MDSEAGTQLIERTCKRAIHFDVIGDAMCIMHIDGSVNMIENLAGGVAVEVIAPTHILKVLQHYRPFAEVFRGKVN